MNLLKRENWWVWLLLALFSGGSSTLVLGALLGCYDKKAWYANWKIWLIGLLCFIFPVSVMIIVLNFQILALTAAKLDVPGKEIYLSPYIWILFIIIPVIGWIMLVVIPIYLTIWTIVSLYRGNGEKYIEN